MLLVVYHAGVGARAGANGVPKRKPGLNLVALGRDANPRKPSAGFRSHEPAGELIGVKYLWRSYRREGTLGKLPERIVPDRAYSIWD